MAGLRPAGATGLKHACPACGSRRSRPATEVRGLHFRRCGECLTLFVQDPPDEGLSAELYTGRAYFQNPRFGSLESGGYHGYKDYLADRIEIEGKFSLVLEDVEHYVTPGRLLDVGAGPGVMLAVARSRGWEIEGVDLNPWVADHARETLGVEVRTASLQEAGFPESSFEAVTMMDVVEHLEDPNELMAEGARITRSGGMLAVLTPDAGSAVSRALGDRWPEVQRAPEHLTLFSVNGLSTLLWRHGFEPLAWRSVGKTSSLMTLAADVAPLAPGAASRVGQWLERRRVGGRTVTFDPRTKFCLYARRLPRRASRPGAQDDLAPQRPPRIPGRPRTHVTPEQAILEDLGELARARGLCDWMFEQYSFAVGGAVAEVGAGIGTFAERMLEAGTENLLLVEPESACADVLQRRFADAPGVEVVRDVLPDAPSLRERAGSLDLVVCQNVLEHVPEDGASIAAMAEALRPGGRLTLLVPAHPRLFGPLDIQYGHERRYTKGRLRRLFLDAGLEIEDLYAFNLLGVPGWWVKGRTGGARLGSRSLAAFELALKAWRPIERRVRPPWGLSLVAHGIRPVETGSGE